MTRHQVVEVLIGQRDRTLGSGSPDGSEDRTSNIREVQMDWRTRNLVGGSGDCIPCEKTLMVRKTRYHTCCSRSSNELGD